MHTHQNATSRLNGAPIVSWFDPRRVLPMMVDATRLAVAAMITPLPPRTGGHALAASRPPASSGSPTGDVVRGYNARQTVAQWCYYLASTLDACCL